MINKNIMITNTAGLHLRPAGILCRVAMDFQSNISFEVRGNRSNAKSVLSVLGACVKNGDELVFTFDGSDEEEASIAVMKLIEEGLGE